MTSKMKDRLWGLLKTWGLPALLTLAGVNVTEGIDQGSDALFHEVISLRADVNGLYTALGIPLPREVPEETVAGLDARKAALELKDTMERLTALLKDGKVGGASPELKEAREKAPLKVRRTRDAAVAFQATKKKMPKSLDELVAQKGY